MLSALPAISFDRSAPNFSFSESHSSSCLRTGTYFCEIGQARAERGDGRSPVAVRVHLVAVLLQHVGVICADRRVVLDDGYGAGHGAQYTDAIGACVLPLLIGARPLTCHRRVAMRWWNAPKNTGVHMEQHRVNVTTRQVLTDLAVTAFAALATGGTVGGIAFLVVKWFA